MDFGFRPDGGGEESLENWSLFKVSKGSGGGSATDTTCGTTGFSFRGSRSSLLRDSSSSKLRLTDAKTARFQKLPVDCDFRQYMSQTQHGGEDMWRSGSAPSLLLEHKKGPSLPQLVGVPQHGRGGPRGVAAKGQRGSVARADLRTTAPIGAGSAKW